MPLFLRGDSSHEDTTPGSLLVAIRRDCRPLQLPSIDLSCSIVLTIHRIGSYKRWTLVATPVPHDLERTWVICRVLLQVANQKSVLAALGTSQPDSLPFNLPPVIHFRSQHWSSSTRQEVNEPLPSHSNYKTNQASTLRPSRLSFFLTQPKTRRLCTSSSLQEGKQHHIHHISPEVS